VEQSGNGLETVGKDNDRYASDPNRRAANVRFAEGRRSTLDMSGWRDATMRAEEGISTRGVSREMSQMMNAAATATAGRGTLASRDICAPLAGPTPELAVTRHTFATHLVKKGGSMRIVQELMGHATIAMTERCAHVASESTGEAVNLIALYVTRIPAYLSHYLSQRNECGAKLLN
jgi:hypothetical protein